MTKVPRATLAILMAGLFAWGGYLTWHFHYGVAAQRTTFSPVVWKEQAKMFARSADPDPGCVRGGMALDIVATDLLLGKTRADVQALLGASDGPFQEGVLFALGQCSGFGWHDSALYVAFGSDQRVHNVRIRSR